MTNEQEYEKKLHEYRTLLLNADQKAQDDYDKTIIALSGGALGISFAFLKDIVGEGPILYSSLLFSAWITWSASLLSVLTSFFLSQKALRKAISQLDKGEIHVQPGGFYSRLTTIVNMAGGILFLSGVVLIVIFARYNLR